VLNKLVLAVVAYTTSIALVWLLICVTTFMIITVSDRRESLRTVFALIGLLPGVDANMYQKVTSLIELLIAVTALELLNALPIVLRFNQRSALSSALHGLILSLN